MYKVGEIVLLACYKTDYEWETIYLLTLNKMIGKSFEPEKVLRKLYLNEDAHSKKQTKTNKQ